MKTPFAYQKLLGAFLITGLLFTACSKDDTETAQLSQTDATELKLTAEIDQTLSAIDDISLNVYETQEDNEVSRRPPNFNLPNCVTVTVVAQQAHRHITIDFGTDGCVVNSNLLKGKILLEYTRNTQQQQVTISKTLEDFYFNAKSIEGSKTIVRQLANANGNPQYTHTFNLTVTWPNGVQASRNGTKIREWIEGAFNGNFNDNVYLVTGNWSATFVNGNTHTYEVLVPLRREVTCSYFVSGSIDIQRTNFGGTFNYGSGACDNQATFTFNNGQEVSVTLN